MNTSWLWEWIIYREAFSIQINLQSDASRRDCRLEESPPHMSINHFRYFNGSWVSWAPLYQEHHNSSHLTDKARPSLHSKSFLSLMLASKVDTMCPFCTLFTTQGNSIQEPGYFFLVISSFKLSSLHENMWDVLNWRYTREMRTSRRRTVLIRSRIFERLSGSINDQLLVYDRCAQGEIQQNRLSEKWNKSLEAVRGVIPHHLVQLTRSRWIESSGPEREWNLCQIHVGGRKEDQSCGIGTFLGHFWDRQAIDPQKSIDWIAGEIAKSVNAEETWACCIFWGENEFTSDLQISRVQFVKDHWVFERIQDSMSWHPRGNWERELEERKTWEKAPGGKRISWEIARSEARPSVLPICGTWIRLHHGDSGQINSYCHRVYR